MNCFLCPGQRRQLLVLGLASLAILAGSCGRKPDVLAPAGVEADSVGQVGFAVTLPIQVGVAVVRYKIVRAGMTPIEGSFPLSDPKQPVSGLVDLPVGAGYLAQFSASSADGKSNCLGDSALFAVLPRQTTSVAVTLQCRGLDDTGTGRLDVGFNKCPQITSVVVAPLAAPLGGSIHVSATALDPEASAPVIFQWSAMSGSFANAGLATTSYVCAQLGRQTITLSVTDGQCIETRNLEVTCQPRLCGNGVLDAGEECDAPQSSHCTSQCRFPQSDPVCRACIGAQIAADNCDSTGCDMLSGADQELCLSLLRCMRTTQCGATNPKDCLCGTAEGSDCLLAPTGVCLAEIQAATKSPAPTVNLARLFDLAAPAGHATHLLVCEQEQCQDACSARVCGNGVIEAPEQCDPPSSPACRPDCTRRQSEACKACEQEHSSEDSCTDLRGCDGLTGVDKDLCESLFICIQDSQCWAKGPLACLCGSIPADQCAITGEANGACKAQMLAATKSTTVLQAGTRMFVPSYPASRATVIAACDFEVCAADCGAPAAFCGDGGLDPGEGCEPPNSPTCDSRCRTRLVGFCGDGRLDPGEECDVPNSPTCSSSCRMIDPAVCSSCRLAAIDKGVCEPNDCSWLTGDDRLRCDDLSRCMRRTGCWVSNPRDCLCGTADGTACASEAANGACRAEIQAATKSTDPIANGTRFFSFGFPAGFATQPFGCEFDNCLDVCQ